MCDEAYIASGKKGIATAIFHMGRCIILFFTTLLISACFTLATTAAPTTTPPIATIPATENNNWQTLAPGLEQRIFIPNGNAFARILALRIDPAQYDFRVHYHPGEPLNATGWQQQLPGAIAFVNANFFSSENTVTGLLVADGVVYGTSYRDFGGTFTVQNGQSRVRSNTLEPYTGELLEQAVQAFPMLVLNGSQAYNGDPDRITRRTAIGQDSGGRIILMVTPLIGLTLPDLSAYLTVSDIGLVNAFNLDGGGSTMAAINAPGTRPYMLLSLDPVPAVLAVYPK